MCARCAWPRDWCVWVACVRGVWCCASKQCWTSQPTRQRTYDEWLLFFHWMKNSSSNDCINTYYNVEKKLFSFEILHISSLRPLLLLPLFRCIVCALCHNSIVSQYLLILSHTIRCIIIAFALWLLWVNGVGDGGECASWRIYSCTCVCLRVFFSKSVVWCSSNNNIKYILFSLRLLMFLYLCIDRICMLVCSTLYICMYLYYIQNKWCWMTGLACILCLLSFRVAPVIENAKEVRTHRPMIMSVIMWKWQKLKTERQTIFFHLLLLGWCFCRLEISLGSVRQMTCVWFVKRKNEIVKKGFRRNFTKTFKLKTETKCSRTKRGSEDELKKIAWKSATYF